MASYFVLEEKCDVCLETKPCLCVDNSDGEYKEVKLCQECINNQF